MTTIIKPHADYWPVFLECWEKVKHLPGDIAEFGVYNGGSSRQLARLGRTVWAFDTYEGIPDCERGALDRREDDEFVPAVTLAEAFGDVANVIPVKGRFCDTLPALALRPMLVMVYIDCDYQKSASDVFDWLPDHLLPGAIVIVDDYATHAGFRAAVDDFVHLWALRFDGEHLIRW